MRPVHACYFERARDANRWMRIMKFTCRGEREMTPFPAQFTYKKVRGARFLHTHATESDWSRIAAFLRKKTLSMYKANVAEWKDEISQQTALDLSPLALNQSNTARVLVILITLRCLESVLSPAQMYKNIYTPLSLSQCFYMRLVHLRWIIIKHTRPVWWGRTPFNWHSQQSLWAAAKSANEIRRVDARWSCTETRQLLKIPQSLNKNS